VQHKFDEIEIRIEEIYDRTEKISFFWSYAHVENQVKLIGKSKEKPNILYYKVQVDS
jgi:hypothetical protein